MPDKFQPIVGGAPFQNQISDNAGFVQLVAAARLECKALPIGQMRDYVSHDDHGRPLSMYVLYRARARAERNLGVENTLYQRKPKDGGPIESAPAAPPPSVGRAAKVSATADTAPDLGPTGTEVKFQTHDNGQATLTGQSYTIQTFEELADYSGVDFEVWEEYDRTANKWEVGAKDEDGEIQVRQLFQVKAKYRMRKGVDRARQIIDDMIKRAAEFAPSYPAIIYPKPRVAHLLEISPFDLHLGKLCWAEETGDNYDSKIAERLLTEAVDALIASASGFPIDRILFPLGQDFFNTDNMHNTTSAGTPQDVDSRWQKVFVLGRELCVKVIDRMSQIAPVDVVIISGNHDVEKSFGLGDSLYCWFNNNPNVTIDNMPKLRKYYCYGKCMIGLTHGDKEPHKELPLIMATEEPKLWGECTAAREIHIGHLHTKREYMSKPADEYHGVRVCVLPSLSGTDAWHKGKGYNSTKAAEAFIWNKEDGRVANFSYYPKAARE